MNAEVPKFMVTRVAANADVTSASRGSARRPFSEGVVHNTALRSTLLGEYVSLLLLAHSLFGAVYWSLHVLNNPASLVMFVSGGWIAFRAVGGFAGEKWAAGVSVLMLIMTGVLGVTGVAHVPVWLSGSLVAPFVWTVFLSLLLLVDCIDCRKRAHADLSLPERRKSDSTSLKLALAGMFFAWGLGVPTVTLIHQLSRPSLGKAQLEEMSFIEHAGFRCGEALVTACFFALGCNIGSFLNVVVWRMPLGKSIVYEKSRCPVCSTAIAGKDNIPIFGWLSLGGQCRACGTDISPRYLIVEAVTGSIFLLLYFVELISGGANLPVRPINDYRGVLWIIMYPKWDLIGLYVHHCFLFSSLLVFTAMAIAGNRIPRKLLAFCFTIAIAAPVAFPTLAVIPALPDNVLPAIAILKSIVHGIAGAICGLIAGTFLSRLWHRDPNLTSQRIFVIASFSLIGIVLGWQAILCIASLFWISRAIRSYGDGSNETFPRVIIVRDLLVMTLLHHVLWRMGWTATNFF